jgi:hypothetical protein
MGHALAEPRPPRRLAGTPLEPPIARAARSGPATLPPPPSSGNLRQRAVTPDSERRVASHSTRAARPPGGSGKRRLGGWGLAENPRGGGARGGGGGGGGPPPPRGGGGPRPPWLDRGGDESGVEYWSGVVRCSLLAFVPLLSLFSPFWFTGEPRIAKRVREREGQ